MTDNWFKAEKTQNVVPEGTKLVKLLKNILFVPEFPHALMETTTKLILFNYTTIRL